MVSERKLKVGLVGTYRKYFSKSVVEGIWRESIRTVKDLTAKEGCEFYPTPELVITSEDVIRTRNRLEEEQCDFVIIQSSSFASGDLFYPFAGLDVRLGIWAVPEPSSGGTPPLNSFCGMNMNASILKNYHKGERIYFKWFFGGPKDEEFRDRLSLTLRVLSTVKFLSQSRLALLGGVAPGYHDLCVDERILQALYGVTVARHEIGEVIRRADKYTDTEIAELVKQIRSEGKNVDVDSESFNKTGRMYLTLRTIAQENDYAALAVSCWPTIREEYNLSVCSALGRLNQDNVVAACEGDLGGALSMLILNCLNRQRSTLMDLVKFDVSDNSVLFWHCGPAARCWANDDGVSYRTHFGARSGVVNDLVFRPQPATILRVTGEGDRILAVTANIAQKEKESYVGSRGWFEDLKIGPQNVSALDLIETIIAHGVEHHYAIGQGRLDDEVMELAYWLNLEPLPVLTHTRYAQDLRLGIRSKGRMSRFRRLRGRMQS